jgi:PAS domain S-box-containing protein
MFYGTMGFGRAFGSASPWLAHILSTLVVALSMSSVSARIQPWVSRLIHGKSATVRDRLIRDSGRLLMSVRSLDSVYKEFASIVSRVLDAEDVRILVLQGSEFEEAFPADGTKTAFSESHPIVRRVIRIPEPTPRYSVERESPTVERNELMEAMDQSDIHLFAPVLLPNGVGALVLMGARSTGFFYGGQEIDLIRNLCDQFGFALDNARLYTEVEEGKRYNETILESLSSGVIACDARRRITLLNREAARVMGVEPAEMVGRPADALPAGLTEMMENALGGGNGAREAEITLPGEPVRYLRVTSSVFTGIEGRRLGALLVVTDVTALRRMEDTMRRADRLASVGTLAAGMAHEIKNPLVTIKTFVQVLPRAFDDPEVRETFCPLIESEVSRIDTVVNSLLNFARPAKAELAPIRLHEVLVRTLRLVEPRLHSAGIEIRADLNAEDDRIEGDASLLEQVFINLYFNAADAMKSGGRLSVETRNVRMETGERDLWGAPVRVDRLRVTVRDTGHGIPPEAIGHVFDPFFTTKPEGSGLGLAISHGIVEEHGGSFEVESTVGAGAAFHVSFPPIPGKDAAA